MEALGGRPNEAGIPPRRDLRMEAMLDILDQKLLVSSHGYRADEFLALVRLAEEFGFRVQTLQHGVEAYKIASELKKSGVAAVVWSDWGAFKLEAYDATNVQRAHADGGGRRDVAALGRRRDLDAHELGGGQAAAHRRE